jgi:predicted O-methyltransferase YrrM
MLTREARALVTLIQEQCPDCKRGAEIGVWHGLTSYALLARFPYLQLLAVDPWDLGAHNPTMPKNTEELKEARLAFHKWTEPYAPRRIVIQDTSFNAAEWIADWSLDFVFIDAVHTYEFIKRDLELYYPKVKPGGLFSGHDYCSQQNRTKLFGVKRAVNEFAELNEVAVNVAPSSIWWWIKP